MAPVAGCLVLIVEDDPGLRQAWEAALDQRGYAVRTAEDLPQAMAQARALPAPQLALLDLGLPPHPGEPTVGLDLLTRLLQELPRMKVVILTGQDEPAISWKAIGLGAFDYLTKPASTAQVLQAFQRAELFLASERQLAQAGQARITVTARVAEGVREFGDAAQERLVREVLADNHYNVTQAARLLGLSREHLYYFIRKFGIERQTP